MSLVWLRSTSVYALILSHCQKKFHSLWSVVSVAEKKFKHDEGHDVERLPIMGTTTALRPGELWQLLRQVARRSALLLRPSLLNQSGGRREESANQKTGPGKL